MQSNNEDESFTGASQNLYQKKRTDNKIIISNLSNMKQKNQILVQKQFCLQINIVMWTGSFDGGNLDRVTTFD